MTFNYEIINEAGDLLKADSFTIADPVELQAVFRHGFELQLNDLLTEFAAANNLNELDCTIGISGIE